MYSSNYCSCYDPQVLKKLLQWHFKRKLRSNQFSSIIFAETTENLNLYLRMSCCCSLVTKLCVTLLQPQAPLSM